ncbi:hypothetical protein ACIQSO_12830 [Pseudomonas putida]|uniref:hypothetical protein n=1 Tax=Pseudomonas putida TaxID=303 RepID=UPI00383AAF18
MTEVIPFLSRRTLIQKNIEQELRSLGAVEPLQLPSIDSPLVHNYVNRIEGTYDSARAKIDTDHAIELLYIAYNTTPQGQGDIRVKISKIMNHLIKAQQESERQIKDAARTANSLSKKLRRVLPGWTGVKGSGDVERIKRFVKDDLMTMSNDINRSAKKINENLNSIADRYDSIIEDTSDVTAASEQALSSTLESNERVRQEILEYKAQSKKLENMVAEMKSAVDSYEKRASEYAALAKTNDDRAFIGALASGYAQVISSALPLIAMAGTGGTSSLVAASAVGLKNRKGQGQVQADTTADVIRLKKERSEHNSEISLIKGELRKVEASLSEYSRLKSRETDSSKLQALQDRINDAEKLLGETQARYKNVQQELRAIESALQTMASAATSISDNARQQASDLRQMQLMMLDKADQYETTRREQAAELIEVSVLMAGKCTEQEIIELAVRSLNLSVSALKRTREIVVEMAFFFHSFSDFMDVIRQDAEDQIEAFEEADAIDSDREYLLPQLCETTDEFFISQSGQWQAVSIVSDRFVQTFKDGWSKLNRLSGTYITGQALPAYLRKAAGQLEIIAADRQAASHQREVYLQNYRNELKAQ